jgi:ATP-dependent Clp protease ATP-binding subunit ClpB
MILDLKSLNGEALELYNFLRNRIISQEEAVKEVCHGVQKAFVDLCPENRPLGIFFFAGPTGTGKTKIVHEIAEYFNTKPLIVNCGEFQSSYDIAKLVGSPPGYIGHGETVALFSKERIEQEGKPTIILLDEIEKASPAFVNIMLGIFDKGNMTTGANEEVNFCTSFIFMTSNIGMSKVEEKNAKFGFHEIISEKKQVENTIKASMKKKFSPEFLNRIDKTVVFLNLTRENCREILELELYEVQTRMTKSDEKKIMFVVTDKAKEELINIGYSEEYGARNLKRAIETHIVNPLANALTHPNVEENDIVSIEWDKDFIFEKKKLAMKASFNRIGFPIDKTIPIRF